MLLWVSAAVIVFALAYWRFSFAERKTKARAARNEAEKRPVTAALPEVSYHDALWKKYFASLRQTRFLDLVLLRGREVRRAKWRRAGATAEDDLAA